jgi:hypothetical protein
MAMGIFEQLAWLTKKVKALCCIVENGGGGGCGDCPVTVDGVTITGNGTIANPLVANIPPFQEGNYIGDYGNQINCVVANISNLNYTRIANTLFVWGQVSISPTFGGWEFEIDLPSFASTTAFLDPQQAIGNVQFKDAEAQITALFGTNRLRVYDTSGANVASGDYNLYFVARITA